MDESLLPYDYQPKKIIQRKSKSFKWESLKEFACDIEGNRDTRSLSWSHALQVKYINRLENPKNSDHSLFLSEWFINSN